MDIPGKVYITPQRLLYLYAKHKNEFQYQSSLNLNSNSVEIVFLLPPQMRFKYTITYKRKIIKNIIFPKYLCFTHNKRGS